MIDRILTQTQQVNNNSNSVQRETFEVKAAEPVQSTVKEANRNNDSIKNIEKVIDGMNEFVSASSSHLKFELHDKLNEYYVTIVDDKTKEVIKEIPSKKLLDIYAEMKDFLGLLVDKKI